MSEELKPEAIQPETPDVAQEQETVTVKQAATDVAEKVEALTEAVGAKITEKIKDLKEKAAEVKEKASAKMAKVKETMSMVKEEAADKAVEARDKAVEVKDQVADKAADVKETVVNFGEKTLAELSAMFQELSESVDRMKRSKEAEAIKSAFYKRLGREKAEAGEESPVEEPPAVDEQPAEEAAQPAALADVPAAEETVSKSPFVAIEEGFKAIYNKCRAERAAYNKEQDAKKEENLQVKLGLIEELKALIEEGGEMKDTFPKFRDIQNRWKETGPVPQNRFRDVNDTYQVNVEKFYDIVQINRELRDLDFKKNLEAKTQFCEQAEKLAEDENPVESFKELQKLHEQWKEFGPVAKEYRDAIWERFRAATAVINKKYQAHFEGLKDQQVANLAAKTALCEKVEEIAAREITSSNQWNSLSKEIEDIQAEWRKIGFATRKDNQKIYDRFRAACDAFFARKREYYNSFKENMSGNMERKMAIIEEAESLKDSTDWKATGDRLIELQKMWKEIGAVPRKKSEQLWKRFRAACDTFFEARDKSEDRPKNDFRSNLAAKKALIAEINAFEVPENAEEARAAASAFAEKWNGIGFVPFKEKEAVQAAYKEAMQAKFPGFGARGGQRRDGRGERRANAPLTEKDRLMQEYNQLQQEIQTYENNIGFFGLSKGAESLKAQMQEKINAAKDNLRALMEKIRGIEQKENSSEEE